MLITRDLAKWMNVHKVYYVTYSIVPTAFMATGLIFVCFTMASLMTNDRKFLYLGGKYYLLVQMFNLADLVLFSY